MLAILLQGALVMAAVDAAAPRSPAHADRSPALPSALVGVWEPAAVSSGGMGQVVEFTADGRFLQTIGLFPDGFYRLIGDRLLVAERPLPADADASKALRIAIDADTMTETGPDGSTVRLERVGSAEPGKPAIVGVWIDHRLASAGYTRFGDDGRFSYRVPMATKTDRYALDGNVLTLTAENRPSPAKVSVEISADRLFLTGADGRRSEFRKIPAVWYDRDLENAGAKRSLDPKWRLAKVEDDLAHAAGEKSRFADLPEAAFLEAQVGSPEKAASLAGEALRLAEKYPDDVNAIHKANLALGLVALHSGNVADAKSRLLAAGRTTGSGTLDTFGPNMLLAKELLEKGEREVVLEYLELCRKFWKMDRGKLTEWEGQIRSGTTPQFGANLTY